MKFNDVKHDTDSCLDVWNDFYCKVYRNFFGQYFDFEKIEDKIYDSDEDIESILEKLKEQI